jgi:hypothetical protein
MVGPCALTDAEKKDPEWWLNHWKNNTAYFVTHLTRMFFDEKRDEAQILRILRATMPAYVESLNITFTPDIPPREEWPEIEWKE